MTTDGADCTDIRALLSGMAKQNLAVQKVAPYRDYGFARAHGVWTYEPREGRNAATAVCSTSAVVSLAFPSLKCHIKS